MRLSGKPKWLAVRLLPSVALLAACIAWVRITGVGDVAVGIIFVVFGALCIKYAKPLSRFTIDFQNFWLGLYFGERAYKLQVFVGTIAGIVFIVSGILLLLGIANLGE